jgi:hypothetical protein
MHQVTVLEVQVSADGVIDVLVMNQIDYEKLPTINQPLIYSKNLEKHKFSIKIAGSGQY